MPPFNSPAPATRLRFRTALLLSALVLVTLVAAACSGDTTESAPFDPQSSALGVVEISSPAFADGESIPVVVRGKFVFSPDLRVVDLATGKVLAQSKGPRPLNGGYMQVIEDIVLVRQDGTHGEHAQFGFYKVAADGSVRSFTETDWKPPIGGATTSYHHPIFYPAVDGRVFLRQENGIYCWDLRKALTTAR